MARAIDRAILNSIVAMMLTADRCRVPYSCVSCPAWKQTCQVVLIAKTLISLKAIE